MESSKPSLIKQIIYQENKPLFKVFDCLDKVLPMRQVSKLMADQVEEYKVYREEEKKMKGFTSGGAMVE